MRGSVFKMACNERPRGMFVKGGSRTAGITASPREQLAATGGPNLLKSRVAYPTTPATGSFGRRPPR